MKINMNRNVRLMLTLMAIGVGVVFALAINFGNGVASAPAASGCAMTSFAPAVNFDVDNSPYEVTTGDFNADGKLDLVTANNLSADVSVLLGNGAGGFAAAVNFTVSGGPFSVTTGDFNADGKLDLATSHYNFHNVSVLLGDGAGGFAPKVNFDVGLGPASVTTGDFNSDGKTDIATANDGSHNVSVLLGNGTGGFAGAVNFTVGSDPLSVTAGDFNSDAKLDLATANRGSDTVSILLGDGLGGFAAAANFFVGDGPTSVTTGDFNADGKLDLVAANIFSDNVSVLLGDGTGGIAAGVNFVTGNGPGSVTTGDFNADGKLDLATTSLGPISGSFSVLIGDGAGGLAPAVNFSAGNGPVSVTTGDFNADGKLDLATANVNSDNVSVLLNNYTPNTEPDAVADTATVAGESGPNPINVLGNDSDADVGDTLKITAVTQSANSGIVAITGGGTGLTYQPPLNFSGADTFTYTINDGNCAEDTASVTVTVTPPTALVMSLSFNSSVTSCTALTGTVTLQAAAPAGGAVVQLASANTAALVPASVLVPAGATSRTFTISPLSVNSVRSGNIIATRGGASVSRSLSVFPTGPQSLMLAPNPVVGGNTVTGTVQLKCKAAPGGVLVELSSSSLSTAMLAVDSFQIAEGQTMGTFQINTSASTRQRRTATIRARVGGVAATATLTVTP